MNEKDIKKIVEELCAADGALRGRERELTVLVQALASKPHVERDPDFERTLRAQLIAELSLRKSEKSAIVSGRDGHRSALRLWSLIFSGTAVAAMALAVWLGFSIVRPRSGGNSVALIPAETITRVGNRAFGPVSLALPVSPTAQMPEAAMNAPVSMKSAAVSMMSISPVPSPATITYIYQGKAFSQNDAVVDVFKRTTSTLSLGDIAAALEQAGFGSISTSSFDNAAVTNLTFMQNDEFGYAVTIDFLDGRISIDPNGQWPSDGVAVPKSLPSSSVLGIANQFLKDHTIQIANYGAPEVTANSDGASVFYPEIIDGMEIYSMDGEKTGLTVDVSPYYQRVGDVYGLNIQNYDVSSYDAITDTAKIISLAEQEAGSATTSAGATTQEVGLGTPVRAYGDNGKGFLVPVFVFPILGSSTDFGSAVVIVPLVKT